MSSETEVKNAEVVKDIPSEAKPVDQQMQLITGKVEITLDANGGLGVVAPPNVIQALAIIEAGKAYLMMQMQDAMRRTNAARPPAILRAGADALSKITRPS